MSFHPGFTIDYCEPVGPGTAADVLPYRPVAPLEGDRSIAGYSCAAFSSIASYNKETTTRQTKASCATACDATNWCKSFEFNNPIKTCYLQEVDRRDEDLRSHANYDIDYCEPEPLR